MVDTLPETISEVVDKTFADILSCLETEALFNTEGDTVLAVEAFTDVNTLNEVKTEALVFTQAHTFP